jgi:hypothetical protein
MALSRRIHYPINRKPTTAWLDYPIVDMPFLLCSHITYEQSSVQKRGHRLTKVHLHTPIVPLEIVLCSVQS